MNTPKTKYFMAKLTENQDAFINQRVKATGAKNKKAYFISLLMADGFKPEAKDL